MAAMRSSMHVADNKKNGHKHKLAGLDRDAIITGKRGRQSTYVRMERPALAEVELPGSDSEGTDESDGRRQSTKKEVSNSRSMKMRSNHKSGSAVKSELADQPATHNDQKAAKGTRNRKRRGVDETVENAVDPDYVCGKPIHNPYTTKHRKTRKLSNPRKIKEEYVANVCAPSTRGRGRPRKHHTEVSSRDADSGHSSEAPECDVGEQMDRNEFNVPEYKAIRVDGVERVEKTSQTELVPVPGIATFDEAVAQLSQLLEVKKQKTQIQRASHSKTETTTRAHPNQTSTRSGDEVTVRKTAGKRGRPRKLVTEVSQKTDAGTKKSIHPQEEMELVGSDDTSLRSDAIDLPAIPTPPYYCSGTGNTEETLSHEGDTRLKEKIPSVLPDQEEGSQNVELPLPSAEYIPDRPISSGEDSSRFDAQDQSEGSGLQSKATQTSSDRTSAPTPPQKEKTSWHTHLLRSTSKEIPKDKSMGSTMGEVEHFKAYTDRYVERNIPDILTAAYKRHAEYKREHGLLGLAGSGPNWDTIYNEEVALFVHAKMIDIYTRATQQYKELQQARKETV